MGAFCKLASLLLIASKEQKMEPLTSRLSFEVKLLDLPSPGLCYTAETQGLLQDAKMFGLLKTKRKMSSILTINIEAIKVIRGFVSHVFFLIAV